MSFEIGPVPPIQPATASARPSAPSADFALVLGKASAPAPAVDTAQLSLPAYPPAEVLDAVGAAANRVDELVAQNRELHFRKDEETGRVIVEVRDLDGNVIRTIPPSHALEIMSGAAV
jgi:flagellar protein FlaG